MKRFSFVGLVLAALVWGGCFIVSLAQPADAQVAPPASCKAATTTRTGCVTTGAQSFAGSKTFTGEITAPSVTVDFLWDNGSAIFGDAVNTSERGGLNFGQMAHWADFGPIASSGRCTATLATAAIAAGATATQDITCDHAGVASYSMSVLLGGECIVGGPATLEAGLLQTCLITAPGVITLRTGNNSAGAITPAAGQTVSVRYWNPIPPNPE